MDNQKTSYKLMSLDLDGTLLSTILLRAKKADCQAVQDYMSAGGIPFINTGRAPWAIRKTVNRINNVGPNKIKLISCWNGAYLKDLNDGEIIEKTISHEHCKKILDISKQYKGAHIWFHTTKSLQNETVYVHPKNLFLQMVYPLAKLENVNKLSDITSYKIDIISAHKPIVSKIYHELVKQNLDKLVTISHSSPRLIEITPYQINKGYAVNYFAKKYNIAKNEIVTIGDSFNDLSAFQQSALAIGINPRNPNLLKHCDAIIKHKSKGVKEAIEDFLIKNVDNAYKLIFTDLDGTLIDNKTKLFSKATKIALQQCTNHLIPIAIASGRSIHDGIKIVESMELNPKTNIYIIGNNGATIFDIFTKKYISQSPIDDADARHIFKVLVDYANKANGKLGFIIYHHSLDLLFYNEPFWKVFNFNKTGFEDKYDPWMNTKPIYVTEYPNDIICYKFVVKFPDPEWALKGCEELRKIFPNLEVCLSSTVNLEINKKGVNKGFAGKKLLEQINISADKVLVLGDGQNDIPALKLSPHSFVPGYSPDYVKKEAKHVINGVTVETFASTVISQYVLKKGKR